MENKKKLTLFETASVVAGLGIGGGVMAVPYLASFNGVVQILAILVVAYLVSLLLHLMIAEMVITDGKGHQLVELFGKYLFKGRGGIFFTWAFFALIVIGFFSLLAGYIVGCGEILVNLFQSVSLPGMPLWVGELLTYLLAAGVVFFGIKGLGLSEKFAVLGIAILLGVLTLGSLGTPFRELRPFGGGLNPGLALYGMAMFALAVFFSVPQVVEGLAWKPKMVPWAVAIGLGITWGVVLVITLMSLLVSRQVTEVALLGWGQAVGPWHLWLGSLFALLALLTSYWSVSYALAVIVKERVAMGDRTSWLIATLPSLLLALSGLTGFMGFMRIVGGAMAVLVALLIIPALRICRWQAESTQSSFRLGFWGSTAFQALVIIAYLVMAWGSLVSLD